MDRPLSREEKRKNKKKERKRQQRRLLADAHQKMMNDSEMDNTKESEIEKDIQEEEKVIPKNDESTCCECNSKEIRYRCDN